MRNYLPYSSLFSTNDWYKYKTYATQKEYTHMTTVQNRIKFLMAEVAMLKSICADVGLKNIEYDLDTTNYKYTDSLGHIVTVNRNHP